MRAEELIARVWTQKKQMLADGKRPTRVVISKADYLTIQTYHRGLGFLPDGVEDYISRYALFDLPFFLDESAECRVADDEPFRGTMFDFIPFTETPGGNDAKELHLFARSECPYCKQAIEFLKNNEIAFAWVETDGLPVDVKRRLRNEFIRSFKVRMHYPTLVVNREKVLTGFEIEEWREEFEIEKG